MKRIMIAAMQSGSGKTVVTCALLTALKKRGLDVRAFKCGPDYIDPMFHSQVLQVPSHNLDLFLQGREGIMGTLSRSGGQVNLLEGVMGFYDGVGGTDEASAWQVSRETGTPVVLALRPKGVGITLAAQVQGMLSFRPDSGIRGLLLADCTAGLAGYLRPVLEKETGLPVLGYLPPMAEAELESRHLGLLTAGEINDLTARFDKTAAVMEQTVDIDALLSLAADDALPVGSSSARQTYSCRIAVAMDDAFCFYYADNLELLEACGAELVFFSPLRGDCFPRDADGLYLGGGYPELHGPELAANEDMRRSIAQAIRKGTPTVAECGGFLFLNQSLEDDTGQPWPMCGVTPGAGFKTNRLQRFGYQTLRADSDSLLLRRGEQVPAHEFHYWDSTDNGAALTACKPDGRSWACGYATETMFAAFPHLHFGGELPLAERFCAACAKYRAEKEARKL